MSQPDDDMQSARRQLTPAQCHWLRKLYGEFEAAQAALNQFTRYLMDEHQIPDNGSWEISKALDAFLPADPDQS